MNLPILFVIENNLYSVNSAKTDRKSPNHSYEKICEGMDIHYSVTDGNNVNNVYGIAKRVISDMKLTKKPAVIECITYRHMAHSAPIRDDKAGYRVVDTEDVREQQDSLQKLRAELVGAGEVANIEEIEKQIDNQVALALEKAVNSPEPEIVELAAGVFAK
jgi:TPP-dependent pyruvate/acetoin dehydrogenase alpha subunit